MAIPLGIGLIGLLSGIFGNILSFFGRYLTAKLAIGASAVVFLISLAVGFTIAINAILIGIKVALPSYISFGFALLPSNVGACVGVYVSALVLRYIVDWKVTISRVFFEAK